MRLRYSVVKRQTGLLFHWDYRDGFSAKWVPTTIDGTEGTGSRASVKYALDANGRLHLVPYTCPALHYSASGTALGVLLEGAATNLCTRSKEFDNATWTKSSITVTANDSTAPDGTTTADLLTASGSNGTCIQDLGAIASAIKAGGVWIKRKTGTGNIQLTLNGGSNWTTVTVTSSWTRVQISSTLANPDFGIRIVTSGDAVWVWNAQVEERAFLTSDIETAGSTGTRAADTLEFPALWTPQDCTIYLDTVDLGTFSGATGPLLLQLGDNDSGTSATAYLHCNAVGDVRLTHHNGSSSVTADVTSGAVAAGDQHEIRAALLAAGPYVARSINGAAESIGSAGSALAHPSAYAEQVLTVTPGGTFTGAHCIRSIKIAAGEQTLAYMRAVE